MPTATVRSRNDDEIAPVLPGDDAGIERVEQWLQALAVSHDPALREQIVLAYLGLADRLADRYRSSRGTSGEDLTQTARAALVAAVDRYDPTRERGFVPFARLRGRRAETISARRHLAAARSPAPQGTQPQALQGSR